MYSVKVVLISFVFIRELWRTNCAGIKILKWLKNVAFSFYHGPFITEGTWSLNPSYRHCKSIVSLFQCWVIVNNGWWLSACLKKQTCTEPPLTWELFHWVPEVQFWILIGSSINVIKLVIQMSKIEGKNDLLAYCKHWGYFSFWGASKLRSSQKIMR